MRIAIVTAADSKYLPAACCALLSCVGDGEVERRTEFFLLACGVSAGDAEKARSFLKSRGVSIEVIAIEGDCLQPFRVDSYVSAAAYSRLLLEKLFDDRWDRILYLDADTRIMVRLQTLLDASLHGRPVGAVHDYLQYLIYGIEDRRERLALRANAPYFNSGIVYFDWPATIASGLLQRARAFAIESGHLCLSHDQDALNKAFEGAWTPLDPRWNFMTVAIPETVMRLDYPARFGPYISHFAGPVKPWMASFPKRYEHHRAWYREMLRESPWPTFAEAAIAPPGKTCATSAANRVNEWLLTQGRRLVAAYEWLSPAETASARRQRGARPIKYPSAEALENDEANPKLEHLFDLMVAEASQASPGIPFI